MSFLNETNAIGKLTSWATNVMKDSRLDSNDLLPENGLKVTKTAQNRTACYVK